MKNNYLLEDDEIIYTEEEAKNLTYNFIDEQTKILEKEIFKKCLTSEELKKELDIKIENEAKKLKQNLQKRKNNILVTI